MKVLAKSGKVNGVQVKISQDGDLNRKSKHRNLMNNRGQGENTWSERVRNRCE